MRRRRAEQPTPRVPDAPGRRDEADDAVLRLVLRQALARLPHKSQTHHALAPLCILANLLDDRPEVPASPR